jgi:hypothetical protein
MNDKAQRASGVDRTMHSALGSTDQNREPECFQDHGQLPRKEIIKYQKPPEEEPTMIMGRTLVNNHSKSSVSPVLRIPDVYPGS